MVRAAPLSPDARRASIIAATLPLLRMYGREVTTSQIALAAGVAEGTLFRVFPDKETLITAAVASVFDPTADEAGLAGFFASCATGHTPVSPLYELVGQGHGALQRV